MLNGVAEKFAYTYINVMNYIYTYNIMVKHSGRNIPSQKIIEYIYTYANLLVSGAYCMSQKS